MKPRTILPATAAALLLAACGASPEDLTLGEWERLDRADRQAAIAELGEERYSLLMLGAIHVGLSGDTARVKQMTVREVIERGRVARGRNYSGRGKE